MLYRPAQAADFPALAHIRAREWANFEYWMNRIAGYLEGGIHPQRALPSRTCYVAVEQSSVVGFVAGHLTRRYGCEGELEWINVIPERTAKIVRFAQDDRALGLAATLCSENRRVG